MGELSYPTIGVGLAKRAQVDIRAAAPPFLVGALCVVGLGAAHGGYFPTAWGWAIVAFVAALAWSLTVGSARRPTALEGVFLGALLAFAGWFALSGIWGTASASSDETVRVFVYVVGAAGALSVVRRATVPALVAGVLAGTTALAVYALASRLFPDRIGTFDSVAGYRLATPIGYWNALGLLCALAVLLAVGLAGSTSSPVRTAFAAAPVPVLLATLYFTFSRGSWIALGVGLVVAIALDPRRLKLTAVCLTATGPAALVVLAASRSVPLTHLQSTVAGAAHDGHRLALLVLAFVVAAAALTAAVILLPKVVSIPRADSRIYPIAHVAAAVVVVVVALIRVGGPSAAASRVWDSFSAAPPKQQGDLGK
ncbi:MAG: O-antigen polymerase, partial [bacterium]|nr:O-antigen polymerase [bacterium]